MDLYTHIQSLPTDFLDMVTEEEAESVIISLPLKKAAGPDHLTNEHLKFRGSNLPIALTQIFDAILISGHIPAAFTWFHYSNFKKP